MLEYGFSNAVAAAAAAAAATTMKTPWDRNTKGDEDYRAWLLKDMTPEEYNLLDPVARRTLRTQFEQQRQQQQQPIIQRTVSCRMWVGEDMTFYELPAPTITTKPESIPSQLELQHMSLSDSESISASSGRGHPQELFRNAVRMRDKQKCVLTGTQLRPKTGNVEAAHIIGVERSLAQARQDAGVWNAYDTQNGMLLESSLHTDFDSFFWCMDEFLNVHVSEAGRGKGLGYLDGKRLNLRLDEQNYPSRKILRARYELFLERTRARESKIDVKKRRRKHITAFTV